MAGPRIQPSVHLSRLEHPKESIHYQSHCSSPKPTPTANILGRLSTPASSTNERKKMRKNHLKSLFILIIAFLLMLGTFPSARADDPTPPPLPRPPNSSRQCGSARRLVLGRQRRRGIRHGSSGPLSKQKQLGQSLRELAQQQKTDLYSLHEPRKVGSNDKHGC